MASVSSAINLVITGATRGLGAAAAEAEAMASRVADAEDRVSAARTRSAAAEDRVGAAETRLAAARQGHDAALSRIGVAETNLEQVRDRSNGATTRLSQAEGRLEELRRNGGSAEAISRAEQDVARVRTESDRAAQALQRAESQLATARANAERSSARVRGAEAALARARSDAVRASEAAARAENDLNNLRRRGNRDTDEQRSGILGVFDAFSRLRDALTGADDAANRFLSTGAALQNLFGTIGGPIVQTVFGIIQLIALFGALGEIVGVVGGVLGQALAGIPALLLAIAAAGGTVLLGMDGIKKAAEALTPAFDKLKASVSDTFQRELTPAFRELAGIIPRLTADFQDVARAVSFIISDFAKFAASKAGFEDLQGILAGTSALLTGMRSGIADFTRGLLEAGRAAGPAMEALGVAIGNVFSKIGDVFTRLSGDGTIAAAIVNLASTLRGLGDVVAAVIEALIRMGAALDFGPGLTQISDIIRSSIPFFEHLAKVAGELLVSAFDTIGPAIQRFIGNGIGPANSAMDQFASFMKSTVFPAVRDFIDWLSGPGLQGAKAFALGLVAQFTSAASGVLQLVSGMLAALRDLFVFLAVQTGDQKFLQLAEAANKAKLGVDGVKTTMDGLHDKSVTLLAQTVGESQVHGLVDRMAEVKGKTVDVVANVPGGPTTGTLGNQILTGAIGAVINKTVTTTSDVPGSPTRGTFGNQALSGAIGAVNSKVVTTTGNVPEGSTLGKQGNQLLKGAIDQVNGKTVTVQANVNGTSAVRDLINAISNVVSKTVNVTVNTIQRTLGFAQGGFAPGGVPIMVGERGPEMIILPRGGGFVNTAEQTKALLNNRGSASRVGTGPVGGDAPITVMVNLSQEAIAGIAEVVVSRGNRTTKRTVLAGSGVTV